MESAGFWLIHRTILAEVALVESDPPLVVVSDRRGLVHSRTEVVARHDLAEKGRVRIAREDVALVLVASGAEPFLGSEDQRREWPRLGDRLGLVW